MGGNIYLDKSYHSGIDGCPGARFVIELLEPPLELDKAALFKEDIVSESTVETASDEDSQQKLPDRLSVLFVDDDMILRKLFARSLGKTAPGWTVRDASCGETALQKVEEEAFDLIFMDQYMASVEKRLLGTETVVALRAKGVESRVCGLSANDVEDEFRKAGADAFMLKPFPTKPEALTRELLRVLYHEKM